MDRIVLYEDHARFLLEMLNDNFAPGMNCIIELDKALTRMEQGRDMVADVQKEFAEFVKMIPLKLPPLGESRITIDQVGWEMAYDKAREIKQEYSPLPEVMLEYLQINWYNMDHPEFVEDNWADSLMEEAVADREAELFLAWERRLTDHVNGLTE